MKDKNVQTPPCAGSGAARPSDATIALIREYNHLYWRENHEHSECVRWFKLYAANSVREAILSHPREAVHIALKALCDQQELQKWIGSLPDFPHMETIRQALLFQMRNEYGNPPCRRFGFSFLDGFGVPKDAWRAFSRTVREFIFAQPIHTLYFLMTSGLLTPDGVFLFDDISPKIRNAVREFLAFELTNPVEAYHE